MNEKKWYVSIGIPLLVLIRTSVLAITTGKVEMIKKLLYNGWDLNNTDSKRK
jgi:hypothetical protein